MKALRCTNIVTLCDCCLLTRKPLQLFVQLSPVSCTSTQGKLHFKFAFFFSTSKDLAFVRLGMGKQTNKRHKRKAKTPTWSGYIPVCASLCALFKCPPPLQWPACLPASLDTLFTFFDFGLLEGAHRLLQHQVGAKCQQSGSMTTDYVRVYPDKSREHLIWIIVYKFIYINDGQYGFFFPTKKP